jgi:hypothetical protein
VRRLVVGGGIVRILWSLHDDGHTGYAKARLDSRKLDLLPVVLGIVDVEELSFLPAWHLHARATEMT